MCVFFFLAFEAYQSPLSPRNNFTNGYMTEIEGNQLAPPAFALVCDVFYENNEHQIRIATIIGCSGDVFSPGEHIEIFPSNISYYTHRTHSASYFSNCPILIILAIIPHLSTLSIVRTLSFIFEENRLSLTSKLSSCTREDIDNIISNPRYFSSYIFFAT